MIIRFRMLILVAFVSVSGTIHAQAVAKGDTHKIHKVVMQVTDGDSLSQVLVIGQVKNIKKTLAQARIEVVCHGDGLEMLMISKSKVPSLFEELKNQDVHFVACENTMARRKVTVQDLCQGVDTVPSGMVEIILKQENGWSYVKGGH